MLGFGKGCKFQIHPEPQDATETAVSNVRSSGLHQTGSARSLWLWVTPARAPILLAHQLQARAEDHQKHPELCPPSLTYLALQDLPEGGLNSAVEEVVKPSAEENREEPCFSSEAAAGALAQERETLEMRTRGTSLPHQPGAQLCLRVCVCEQTWLSTTWTQV